MSFLSQSVQIGDVQGPKISLNLGYLAWIPPITKEAFPTGIGGGSLQQCNPHQQQQGERPTVEQPVRTRSGAQNLALPIEAGTIPADHPKVPPKAPDDHDINSISLRNAQSDQIDSP